eukprot:CAMPEP_0194150626 /NCGR_PEP_ID=MMETSP0152-20130528/44340_1 /TAXON_ID=1049557 /ORGANISM="Thalassiothrix antarctica, Strain L6-D1" /LENGTH=173 /DNA_ID=CAMNT_0038853731 /DNA_START=240 /DNA_END=761 /DNA_ORIENTATION=+
MGFHDEDSFLWNQRLLQSNKNSLSFTIPSPSPSYTPTSLPTGKGNDGKKVKKGKGGKGKSKKKYGKGQGYDKDDEDNYIGKGSELEEGKKKGNKLDKNSQLGKKDKKYQNLGENSRFDHDDFGQGYSHSKARDSRKGGKRTASMSNDENYISNAKEEGYGKKSEKNSRAENQI